MPAAHEITLDPSTILCEGCGYILNGLPTDSRCPECGKPIAESLGVDIRRPPDWERGEDGGLRRFARAAAAVLFRPTHFYRTLQTRTTDQRSYQFARIHWMIGSFLTGTAVYFHVTGYLGLLPPNLPAHWALLIGSIVLAYVLIAGTTRLTAQLSAWEAAYRGLRLPLAVVVRGLHYHAAHVFPVAAVFWLTVMAFPQIDRQFDPGSRVDLLLRQTYDYTLAGLVIVAAVFLFKTYWIAMRNMMYANR